MARATFVKKARKAVKSAGIKVGDSYFWWKFRFGGKHYSKTRPRDSQLTQSEFYSTIYAASEDIQDCLDDLSAFVEGDDTEKKEDKTLSGLLEDLADTISSSKDSVQEAGESCDEKLNNMPDSLQQSPTGELLQERYDSCEQIVQELDEAEQTVRDLVSDDDKPDEDKLQEATSAVEDIGWDVS